MIRGINMKIKDYDHAYRKLANKPMLTNAKAALYFMIGLLVINLPAYFLG